MSKIIDIEIVRTGKTIDMGVTKGEAKPLQDKSVEPSPTEQVISPDSGYYGLHEVTVGAAPLQSKTVKPAETMQLVEPDDGYYGLDEVIVESVELQDKTVTPNQNAQVVSADEGYHGLDEVIVFGAPLQNKSVTPTHSQQVVTPDNLYYGLGSVTVNSAPMQSKTVTPTTSQQQVTADSGYYGLNEVTVQSVPLQNKTVEHDGEETIEVIPDEGYMGLSMVTIIPPIQPDRTLKFTNVGETSSSISMSKVGEAPDVDVRYSLDNGSTWNFFTVDETTIELDSNEKVIFIGYNDAFATSIEKYNKFVTTGDLRVEGDVTSLLNGKGGDVDLNDCAFTGLFEYTTILNTPKLPSLNLAYACYYGMFRYCDKLVLVTELPSINVIRAAYQLMFYHCTSLIQAPSLPAKNVANAGYYRMFDGCSSLTIPPNELPAKIVNEYSYSRMFFGCTSLTKMPKMSLNIIETYGMQQMFRECSSLVDIDLSFLKELTTPYCVALMFRGCTSLETAILPELVSINATYATQQMFYQCTSLKNVSIPKLETITGDYASYYMFHGCTGLQNVDMSLLKTASGSYALAGMFYGCTSLLNVSLTSFETASGDYIMQSMFNTAKIEEINMPNLTSITGVSACDSTFRGPSTYDYTLKRLLLPKLNTLSGTGIGITMCQLRRGLSYVDLSSLTTIGNTNSRFEAVFTNCTTFYTVKIHPSATQYTTTNNRAILVSATYLRNIEFTTDASTNIYLNWQGSLNFGSIQTILEHCNNANMSGKSITFKSGFSVTDDADGTLATLKAAVLAQGATINNLTINPYTP